MMIIDGIARNSDGTTAALIDEGDKGVVGVEKGLTPTHRFRQLEPS